MRPDIKARWAGALRSGHYDQGVSNLRGPLGYCCLGVLCDLAAADGVGEWDHTDDHGWQFDAGYELSATLLPRAVANWAGLHDNYAGLHDTGGDVVLPGHGHLTDLNDGGASFARIADLIEAEL